MKAAKEKKIRLAKKINEDNIWEVFNKFIPRGNGVKV